MYTLFGGHDDDADMMRFIYECIGYCLVNNTFAQKFFILYGDLKSFERGVFEMAKVKEN